MPHGAIPFPFGDCRVCSDKATGVHYGVATCEGCKGFFKRSLPKADKYRCFNNGQCNFDRSDRNRCKSCRFRRCLDVGMSLEGVKMGRIPKVDKERALEQHRLTQATSESTGSPVERSGSFSNKSNNEIFVNHGSEDPHANRTGIAVDFSGSSRNGSNGTSKRSLSCSSQGSVDIIEKPNGIYKPCSTHCDILSPDANMKSDVAAVAPCTRWSSGRWNSAPPAEGDDGTPSLTRNYNCQPAPHDKWTDGNGINRWHSMSVTEDRTRQGSSLDCMAHSVSDSRDANGMAQRRNSVHVPNGISSLTNGTSSENLRAMRQPSPDISGRFFNQPNGRTPSVEFTNGEQVCQRLCVPEMPAQKFSPNRESSRDSCSPYGISPFGPTVIKELLNQAIQTGHGWQVQHNIARQFCSATVHSPSVTTETVALADRCQMVPRKRPSYHYGDIDSSPLKISNLVGNGVSEYRLCPPSFVRENSINRALAECDLSPHVSPLVNQKSPVTSKPPTSPRDPRNDQEVVESRNSNGTDDTSIPERDESAIDLRTDSGSETTMDEPQFYARPVDYTYVDDDNCVRKIEVPSLNFLDIPESSSGTGDGFSSEELSGRREEMEAVLLCFKHVSQIFEKTISLCEDTYQQEVSGHIPFHPMNMVSKASPEAVREVWDSLMSSVPISNSYILGLCTHVPGFSDFNQKDKATLMEASYFEIWLIQWSPLFHDKDIFMRLPCGVRYSKFWMQSFLPESLVKALTKFTDELNSCQLTPVERTILCAIQLTSTTGRDITDEKRVQQLHDYYLDLLAYEIERNHRTTHSRVLIKIFQLLPMLAPINIEQAEVIMNFRVDSPPDVPLSDEDEKSTSPV